MSSQRDGGFRRVALTRRKSLIFGRRPSDVTLRARHWTTRRALRNFSVKPPCNEKVAANSRPRATARVLRKADTGETARVPRKADTGETALP
jgi:hypothetical protein